MNENQVALIGCRICSSAMRVRTKSSLSVGGEENVKYLEIGMSCQ